MQKIDVKLTHKNYPIYIENGLFKKAGSILSEFLAEKKVIIVTDSNLSSSYGNELLQSLRADKIESEICIIPAGEKSKSIDVLTELYNSFAGFGITRNDFVIALGGGVTGDLTGFAASTWLRGTGFIQIPTSLLSMVDSSIGGKVAINLQIGKNLVGSFYHPEVVLIDPVLLETIPNRYFADGMAEVIKYGCIDGTELFDSLKNLKNRQSTMKVIDSIIFRCCDIKRRIVELDERESNIRMVLNFGHTIGHAIEKYFDYKKYTHGEAVSLGMVFIAELSHKLGYCNKDIPDRITILLKQSGLPVVIPEMEPKAVIDTVFVDKKARTNDINLILIKDIGNVVIEKFPKDKIGGHIYEMLNN